MELRRWSIVLALLLLVSAKVNAQYSLGMTGQLNIPTAEMQEVGTFMGEGNYLPTGLTPFTYFLLATVLCCSGNSMAQEKKASSSFEKYNWFITGGINGEWLTNTNGNTLIGGKVGVGMYLTRFSGIRANLFAGKSLIDSQKALQMG